METRKLIESIEEIEFEELKAELEELTNYNNHAEALVLIADKFAPQYSEKFQKFVDLRDKNNGLSVDEVEERYNLSKEMFKYLESTLGKDKAWQLYSCL